MKYGEALREAMNRLAQDKRVYFIGYNMRNGSKAYQTLADIPKERLIETPVAENLMGSLAVGMALEGYRPVVWFERHDFMIHGLGALVNHVDKTLPISGGQFKAPVIVRATVGSSKPVNPGMQHTQDFSNELTGLFPNCRVHELKSSDEILCAYEGALKSDIPSIFIERRNLYNKDV